MVAYSQHGGPLRLADRLAAARRSRFVGRVSELELFETALCDQPPYAVLHLHGPGGIGKSTLLHAYRQIAEHQGWQVALLDGRHLEASPESLLGALSRALGQELTLSPQHLQQLDRLVVLIDTYELLTPLDSWLRELLLPELPARALVVLAGRRTPNPAWRTDPAWADLVRIVALRNLRPEESIAYLQQRGIDASQHSQLLAFTHGHPLALSVSADLASQGRELALDLAAPDIVALLLERFIQHVPSELHRQAVYGCALARVTTEPVLRAVLRQEDVRAIFDWLRELSFIEAGPFGIFPHDLAREVLDRDLRWRDPEQHVDLHGRVRSVIMQRIEASDGVEKQRAMLDLVYLHRNNPLLKSTMAWREFGTVSALPAEPRDYGAIVALVEQYEGQQAAELASFWLERQPEAWLVVRGVAGEVLGFACYLALHQASPHEIAADPATAQAWAFACRRAPARPGEEVMLARWLICRESYQGVTPVIDVLQIAVSVRWLTALTPAWTIILYADPDSRYTMMSYLNYERIPEADAMIGERRYGAFAHDWRVTSATAWVELLAGRELAESLRVEDVIVHPAVQVVLSQPEFEDAVRMALRDFHRRENLASNPLLRSRLIGDAAGAEALQSLLRSTAEQLRATPKDEKLYRAVAAAYLTPAATQELAAERLGLPFSTFRHHLTSGIERITAALWRRELAGGS